ncbi:hypothetical protein RI367_005553 [Sorochytrium milnesiophthora]
MLAFLVILALLALPLQIAATFTNLNVDSSDRTPIELGSTLQLTSTSDVHRDSILVRPQWQVLGKAPTEYSAITMNFQPEANADLQMAHQFEVITGQTEITVIAWTSSRQVTATFSVPNSRQHPAHISVPLNNTGGIVSIDLNFSRTIWHKALSFVTANSNKRVVTATLRTSHQKQKFDRSFEVQLGETAQVKTTHWTDAKLSSRRQLHAWVSTKGHTRTDQEQRLRPSSVKVQMLISLDLDAVLGIQTHFPGLTTYWSGIITSYQADDVPSYTDAIFGTTLRN